jgi:hypothetical protein
MEGYFFPSLNGQNASSLSQSGGGGGGWAKNVTWRNFKLENVGMPISVTECVYGHDPTVCDTSEVCRIPCLLDNSADAEVSSFSFQT